MKKTNVIYSDTLHLCHTLGKQSQIFTPVLDPRYSVKTIFLHETTFILRDLASPSSQRSTSFDSAIQKAVNSMPRRVVK